MFKSLNRAISTPIAIIIVIVVGLLAIGGVLAYQYWWQVSEKWGVPCSSEYWEAINKSDVTICESVTNLESESNYCRDNCIKEVAYKKGETKLCELINPDADYNLAEYNSPETLIPIKDFCYMHLAEKLDDVSLCNNVESDWAKANCPILFNRK